MRKSLVSLFAGIAMLFLALTANAQISVSGGTGLAATYPNFTGTTGLFAALNANAQTGNTITVSITADITEPNTSPDTVGLNAGAWTSITITPNGNRVVTSAAIAGTAMLKFNGADNVIIDGLNSGGNSLTISNTTVSATTGTATIRFINGASNNTITNCNLQGSVTSSVATNGAIIFISTDGITANGNDNITISNCDIGPAGVNLPSKCILGNGSTTTTAIGNSGIVIRNNNIHDYFAAAVTSAGVATNAGCNNWTVDSNRFYQTATRTWTTGAIHNAIALITSTATSGMQGAIVTNNIIGYATSSQTGTYTLTGSTGKFIGINVNAITLGTLNRISKNTVASVSLSGVTSSGTSTTAPFIGILATNGVCNTDSNTIGSQSATGSLVFSTNSTTTTDIMGIYNFSSDVWNARNNTIGGISATNAAASGTYILYGIRANTGTGVSFRASNNIVGGTVANSMQLSATGAASQVIGMHSSNAPAIWFTNTIRNLTNNIGTGTTTAASVIGMNMTSTTPTDTVSQNTIYSLGNTNVSAATTVCGIQFTGSASGNLIERNFIHSFTNASTAGIMNGMNVSGGTSTYRNNMIRLGIDGAGASITNSVAINGINALLGTDNFYNNSVYVGGTGVVSGTVNSYAFNHQQTVNTRNFRNNIFWNARSNASGTGKNYAVRVGGTTVNPTGLTSDYNLFYASGTGAVFGFYNSLDVADISAWRTATGQDNNSLSNYDPQFIAPTGDASTVNLHISPTNPTVIEGSGIAIATVVDDFDGQTRSGLTPTDRGADAGNFVAQDVSAPGISYTALTNTSSLVDRVLSATITDNSGVPTAGALQPRIYYQKNGGSYFSSQGSLFSGSATNGVWNLTIDESDLGGIAPGDVIGYFVIAQDINGYISSNPSAGLVASDVNTVTTPPTTPSTYTIVGVPLSGDYTVGSTMFRAITGLNVSFETRTRKVMKEIALEQDAPAGKNSKTEKKEHLFGQPYEPGTSTMVEVDETYSVPMLDGKEYNGSLYHELTKAEKRQFNLSDNLLGIYATLTAAVADVNLRGIGATDCRLLLNDAAYNTGTGETFPIIIDAQTQLPTASSNLIIKPNTGVTALISTASTSGIIVSRAPYVVFDGTAVGNTGTRDMTIQNTSSAANTYVLGMFNNTAPRKADNNTVKYCNITGGATTASTNATFGLILNAAGGDFDNCLIDNNLITSVRTGMQIAGIVGATSDNVTVSNNVIGSTTDASSCFFQGILIAQADNTIITQNELIGQVLGNVVNGNSANAALTIAGIVASTGATNTKIRRNYIHDWYFAGTTQGYGGKGIVYSNTGNNTGTTEISNNVIHNIKGDSDNESNASTNMGYLPIGICISLNGTSLVQVYNNSVYMSGATLTVNFNGAAACLGVAGTVGAGSMDVRNNLFRNSMTGVGTGATMGIWVPTAASNNIFANINNNNYYSDGQNPVVGYFSTLRATLANWQSASGQDGVSLAGLIPYMSTTDLTIDATSSNAWNVSGLGYPLVAVATDYTGASRSTTLAGGATDLGAYNVTPSSMPPTATESAAPAPSTTTSYTLAGKTLATLTWGAGGTPPTSMALDYFPGANPPGSTGFNVGNGYWVFTPTGGSGYSYDVLFNYNEAQLGTIPTENDIRLAKSDDGGALYTPYLVAGTGAGEYTLNTTANTIQVNGLTSFSMFGLADGNAPLPVELSSFSASINKNNVDLNWSTISEVNNTGFDVERKLVSTTTWSKVGFVAGAGNSTTVKNYTFSDKNLATAKYNYRLKQIDNNGNINYHNLSGEVIVGVPTKFDMSQNYPNPFNPTTKINYDLPFDSKVSIRLFDMTGKEVAQIVNATQTAGYYTAQFNGANLASGVYFYNIIAEGGNAAKFVTTKKMVLVK